MKMLVAVEHTGLIHLLFNRMALSTTPFE